MRSVDVMCKCPSCGHEKKYRYFDPEVPADPLIPTGEIKENVIWDAKDLTSLLMANQMLSRRYYSTLKSFKQLFEGPKRHE